MHELRRELPGEHPGLPYPNMPAEKKTQIVFR